MTHVPPPSMSHGKIIRPDCAPPRWVKKNQNLLNWAIPGISSLNQHGYMNQPSTLESAKFEFKWMSHRILNLANQRAAPTV